VVIVTERLRPETFRLPVEKIRAGYKSDIYFARTKLILEQDRRRDRVTMQVFQKHPNAVIVGTDHTLAILQAGAGRYRDRKQSDALFGRYLDAERRAYAHWAALPASGGWDAYAPLAREHLETLYLGALAEGSRVATNTRDVVAAASGKPVIMFGARHQAHEAQAGAGYAAYVGGAIGVSTDEQGEWWGSTGLGTVPHALIAVYGGDTTVATLKFDEYINRTTEAIGHLTAPGTPEGHVNVTSLVDFQNDVVNTSLGVAHALGQRLWGVRVDTSESLIDKSILREIEQSDGIAGEEIRGVTPRLIAILRSALDGAGYGHVRIVASGGFDAEKIARFERLGVPVDVYGVGSALVHGSGFDHTADIVRLEGRDVAKVGRAHRENARLHDVDWRALVGERAWAHSTS